MVIDKIFSKIGYDGMEHIIVLTVISDVLKYIIPWLWLTILICEIVIFGKEIYDKKSGKGTAEWRDVLWGNAGMILGLL